MGDFGIPATREWLALHVGSAVAGFVVLVFPRHDGAHDAEVGRLSSDSEKLRFSPEASAYFAIRVADFRVVAAIRYGVKAQTSDNSGSDDWQIAEVQAGIVELESGEGVSHEKVAKWLNSWGTSAETHSPR